MTPAWGGAAASGVEALWAVGTEDDATDEPNGSVTVTVRGGGGYTVGAPASATTTIRDNDTTSPPPSSLPTVGISGVTPDPVSEGGTVTITFTISPPFASATAIAWGWSDADSEEAMVPSGVATHQVMHTVEDTMTVEAVRTFRVFVLDRDPYDVSSSSFEAVISVTEPAETPEPPGVGIERFETPNSISEGEFIQVAIRIFGDVVGEIPVRVRTYETNGSHGTVIGDIGIGDIGIGGTVSTVQGYALMDLVFTHRLYVYKIIIETEDDNTDDIPAGERHYVFVNVVPDTAEPPRYLIVSGGVGVEVTETE